MVLSGSSVKSSGFTCATAKVALAIERTESQYLVVRESYSFEGNSRKVFERIHAR